MKIVILTIGTRGDVQPYIALGQGLKAAGHDVTLATLAEFSPLVTEYGINHAALRGDFNESARKHKGLISPKLIQQWTRMAQDTLLDEWVAAQDAEVFIYSPAALGGYSIAQKLNVPSFAAFPTPLYTPTREFPSPFFPVNSLGPLNKLSHKLIISAAPALYRKPINQWRHDVLGLPPLKSEEMLNGQPVTKLYAYSEAVVPRPADWDASSIITGYWFLDAPATWQPPADLVQFLRAGPPPVYVGFGSMFMDGGPKKTELIIRALELAGQRGVLATGWGGLSTASILPENIFVLEAAPHDWLFPQVAAVVHHGGAGTTAAALRAGKPNVICPFVGDQPFWGRRVADLGAGPRPISQWKLTPEGLAQAIKTAVTDESMRQQAASLGNLIRSEAGVVVAVDYINRHLQEK